MSITVTSTTDTPDQVAAAVGLDVEPTPAKLPAANANSNPSKGSPDAETGADASSESGDGSGPSENQDDVEDDSTQADHSDPNENSDDDTDDDTDDPAVDSDGKPIKGKGGFQKRIDRATRKIAAAEAEKLQLAREKFELQQRLANLERQISTQPKPKEEVKKDELPVLGPPPKDTDYQTYGEFLNAMSAYSQKGVEHATTVAEAKAAAKVVEEVAKIRAEFEARENQRAYQDQASQIAANFAAKVQTEAKPIYKDWDTVVANNHNLRISDTQRTVMLNHEKGHHLAYWYGKHPAETARIAALPEGMQLLELGQILPTLGKAKSKAIIPAADADSSTTLTIPNPKATSAPKPVKPIGSARPAKRAYTAKDIENMPYQQYKELRANGTIK